ncbi:hypothetical protein, partial [Novosphingobium sp. TCA1]|uniref:hypothetical protein n=1 Tax=Novosphingobium sp. TCA1 TaxID=2682474 RepID=UPI001F280F37
TMPEAAPYVGFLFRCYSTPDIDALRGKSQSEAEPSGPASTDKSGITARSCLGKREASPGGGPE